MWMSRAPRERSVKCPCPWGAPSRRVLWACHVCGECTQGEDGRDGGAAAGAGREPHTRPDLHSICLRLCLLGWHTTAPTGPARPHVHQNSPAGQWPPRTCTQVWSLPGTPVLSVKGSQIQHECLEGGCGTVRSHRTGPVCVLGRGSASPWASWPGARSAVHLGLKPQKSQGRRRLEDVA